MHATLCPLEAMATLLSHSNGKSAARMWLYTEWMQTLCRCALPSVAIPALANDHIEACDMTPQMSLAKLCACTTCAT